jgi:hypothetical protein
MAAPVRVEGWYRSHTASLRRRWTELWETRRWEIESAEEVTVRLGARRMGRTVGGIAGVIGGVAMFGGSALLLVEHGLEPWLPVCLLLGWVVFAMGRLVGGLAGAELFHRRLRALLAREGELVRDVERLEALDVAKTTAALVERLEVGSLAWPLAALSLLAPLSMHFVVWLLLTRNPGHAFDDFGKWIAFSAAIVGHAHVVLALCSWRFVRCLQREPWGPNRGGWGSALGWTVLAGTVPGIIFLAVPPILVALTGSLLIPIMFSWAKRTLERERVAVATSA